MATKFITSENDFQIAYDVQGSGPALMLVHGFGNDRNMWHTLGWVDHLCPRYTVITMDVRGCGESTATHEPTDYSQTAHIADVTNVLDDTGFDECLYWGWSFGGTIGTQMAAFTQRLRCAVIAGTYFGPIFQGEEWRNDNQEIREIALAKREGRLDEIDIPEERRRIAAKNDVELYWARRYGVESWPAVEPDQLLCPGLVYTGSNDGRVAKNLQRQRASMEAAGVQFHSFDGFDHFQLVSERDAVAAVIVPFIQRHA